MKALNNSMGRGFRYKTISVCAGYKCFPLQKYQEQKLDNFLKDLFKGPEDL